MAAEYAKAQVGDFVIINFYDCPCARLVAKVREVSDTVVVADYLSKDVSVDTCAANPSDVRLVSDFGIEVQFGHGGFVCVQTAESRVEYSDGSQRYRQDQKPLKVQKLRTPLLARAVEKAISK